MVDNSKFTGYITINAFYTEYTTCFYKHMKLRNKARLCLAISDFEAYVHTKLQKISPQNIYTGSTPLSVQTHHKFSKFRSFCTKKCRHPPLKNPIPLCQKISTLDQPLILTAEVIY